ncbi:MAG: hypothetical protein ACC628_10370 [Pirellulaceae bacterium]
MKEIDSSRASAGRSSRLPDRDADRARWHEFGLYVVLLLVCALTLSKNQPDPDFWGHVRYGRDMLASGLPDTITYSYTSETHPWINHEILSELLLALGVDTLGAAGVLAIKCLLGMAVVGAMMVRAARRGVSTVGLVVVVTLVSINLMHFWLSRPQLLSYLCFTLLLFLLDHCFRHGPAYGRRSTDRDVATSSSGRVAVCGDTRWLWLAVPLLGVWANSHGGFVAGFAVLAVFLAVRGLEAWWTHSRAAWPLIARFSGVVVASAAATLLNPHGLKLHVWLWGALSEARPEIIEWRSPDLFHVAWIPWWLLVALALTVLWREVRRRMAAKPRGACAKTTSHSSRTPCGLPWERGTCCGEVVPAQTQGGGPTSAENRDREPIGLAEMVILLMILWQAIEHRRNIPFFIIAVGVWLPTQIDLLLARLGRTGAVDSSVPGGTQPHRRRFGIALVVVGLVVGAALFNQLRVMPVLRSIYPVSAFQYMADQNLHGRLITRFMWAQYAIGAFGDPGGSAEATRLAFDGRFRTCYPQELVDMYFDFALGNHPTEPRNRSPESPPIDGSRLLSFRDPDLVLLDRNQPHPLRLLATRQHEWVLLYQDHLAQLWGRSTKYGDPSSSLFIVPEQRQITQEVQEGFVPWPAFPARRAPETHARRVPNGSRQAAVRRWITNAESKLGDRVPPSCFSGTRR